ncbi:MAG: hypothetical protein Unbinned4936contig1000_6 [Prokaryotic dsDNA virus sp.]|nr:MAG: hypothetical protein Unbinned4936contig1000_6 [Prokaryotic dsDNA virus sp.]|tara:strand:- start:322 stop:507 length:186 start_codon:yes stop_codon:yes gene_type:complete
MKPESKKYLNIRVVKIIDSLVAQIALGEHEPDILADIIKQVRLLQEHMEHALEAKNETTKK